MGFQLGVYFQKVRRAQCWVGQGEEDSEGQAQSHAHPTTHGLWLQVGVDRSCPSIRQDPLDKAPHMGSQIRDKVETW